MDALFPSEKLFAQQAREHLIDAIISHEEIIFCNQFASRFVLVEVLLQLGYCQHLHVFSGFRGCMTTLIERTFFTPSTGLSSKSFLAAC